MINPEQELSNLKERVWKLEITVNKSNFSAGLSLLLEEANHKYECLQESLAFDNSAPEKREYRRGQRDAYVSMIESIKEAIKG